MSNEFGAKVKAHQRYYLKDGSQVPGVTTILGVLAKPYLVAWANKKGLEGIDTSKYVDEAASIGTLAHAIIAETLGGESVNYDDFTADQRQKAQAGVEQFAQWHSEHTVEPISVERQMVSEMHRFGGTVDLYGLIDGEQEVIDIKTSRQIGKEHVYQLAAYRRLLLEQGEVFTKGRILRIGRNPADTIEERKITLAGFEHAWQVFKTCLDLYYLTRSDD